MSLLEAVAVSQSVVLRQTRVRHIFYSRIGIVTRKCPPFHQHQLRKSFRHGRQFCCSLPMGRMPSSFGDDDLEIECNNPFLQMVMRAHL